ncbi:MAG: hypothetical protein ACRELD_03660 [Longimicrobiales bacterium]
MQRSPQRHAGATLLELSLALLIIAVLLAAVAPPLLQARDRIAVAAAADAILHALSRARLAAIAQGRAAAVIDLSAARVWTEAAVASSDTVELGVELRVQLRDGTGAGGVLRLPYGPLGLGAATSRTILIRRGNAQSRVIIAAYGRARRS